MKLFIPFALGLLLGVQADHLLPARNPTVAYRSLAQAQADSVPPQSRVRSLAKSSSEVQTSMDLPDSESAFPADHLTSIMSQLQNVAEGKVKISSLASMPWSLLAIELAKQDPNKVFELSLRLPTGSIATTVCVEAARALARRDGPAAWKLLERLGPGSMERAATAAVLEAWAADNPKAAAVAVTNSRDVSAEHASIVSRLWAEKDAAAALAWAQSLGVMARTEAVEALFSTTASGLAGDGSTAQLNRMLSSIEDGELKISSASVISRELSTTDAVKAIQWAATLPAELRDAAVSAAAQTGAQFQVERTAEHLSAYLSSMPSSNTDRSGVDIAVTDVAESFANKDAKSAIAWATKLPTDSRDSAIQMIMHSWAERDEVAASEWLLRNRVDPAVVLAFAGAVSVHDKASALAWAKTCPPSFARDQLMQSLDVVSE